MASHRSTFEAQSESHVSRVHWVGCTPYSVDVNIGCSGAVAETHERIRQPQSQISGSPAGHPQMPGPGGRLHSLYRLTSGRRGAKAPFGMGKTPYRGPNPPFPISRYNR